MSKHSKNNTSSSVFTYAERQKLKGLYGSLQTRIGQDSLKKFQNCTVCHNRLIQPTCCDHGHTFCRSCAIEYIINQKRKQQKHNTQIQKLKTSQQQRRNQKLLESTIKKIDDFQKHDNFLTVTSRDKIFQVQSKGMSDLLNQKLDIKSNIKPTGIYQSSLQKQKYVKSSFWTIQNTPQIQQHSCSKQKVQANFIVCPGPGVKHKLTLKKLRSIKINQIDNMYCCWICRKQIARQPIGTYKCGHLICTNCSSTKCQVCDQKDKWLGLEGNSSSFAQHNKSQVKTYTHAFFT